VRDNEVLRTLHGLYHRNNSPVHEQSRSDVQHSYAVIVAWLLGHASCLRIVRGRADGWVVDMGEGRVPRDGCTTLRGCQCHIHMAHLASATVVTLAQEAVP